MAETLPAEAAIEQPKPVKPVTQKLDTSSYDRRLADLSRRVADLEAGRKSGAPYVGAVVVWCGGVPGAGLSPVVNKLLPAFVRHVHQDNRVDLQYFDDNGVPVYINNPVAKSMAECGVAYSEKPQPWHWSWPQ